MSENRVNYDALGRASGMFRQKAGDLKDLMGILHNQINALPSDGWDNKASHAFVDTFNKVHETAMKRLIAALEEASRELDNYTVRKQEQDDADAAGFGV